MPEGFLLRAVTVNPLLTSSARTALPRRPFCRTNLTNGQRTEIIETYTKESYLLEGTHYALSMYRNRDLIEVRRGSKLLYC